MGKAAILFCIAFGFSVAGLWSVGACFGLAAGIIMGKDLLR